MSRDVVYLSRFSTNCGISTYTEQLAEAVRDTGLSVSAVTSDHTTNASNTRTKEQVSDIPYVVGWSEGKSVCDAIDCILEKNPAVVHIQHEFGIFTSDAKLVNLCRNIKARSTSIKIAITFHTVHRTLKPGRSSFLDLLHEMDIIIVHSEVAKSVMGSYPCADSFVKPVVIPHGMMQHRIIMPRMEAEKALGFRPGVGRFTVLCVGFLSMNKRQPLLLNLAPDIIKALKTVKSIDGHREFNLIIAGSDPLIRGAGKSDLFDTMKLMIDQMKLHKQIRIFNEFVPFERLPIFYGASDACVHMCASGAISSSGSVRMDLSHGMPVFVQRAELTEDLPANVVRFFDQDKDLIPLLRDAYGDGSILKRMSDAAIEMSRTNSWKQIALMHMSAYAGASDIRMPDLSANATETSPAISSVDKNGETTMGGPRVAFISRWGVQCGIATYTDQLANAMCQHGASVVCVAEEVGSLKQMSATPGVEVIRCWHGRSMNVDEIYTKSRLCGAQVIHFQHEFGIMNDMMRMMQLIDALHRGGVPTVVTCHTVMPRPHTDTAWFFNDFLTHVDAIVVHTQDTKNAMVEWGHNPGKIHVISHGTQTGVSVDEKARSREILYLPSRKDIIVAVSIGFITPGKMQKETIKEVIWLVREGLLDPTKFLYIVAGEPGQNDQVNVAYCREIHKIIDENRAWNYIKVVPRFVPVDELPVWYGAADFAITASHQTFFSTSGRSHQEMAYGVPSISSNARLLSDLDETRSLKFDFDDEEAYQFRFSVLAMVRDPKLRAKLARNCLKFASETSWMNVAEQHLEVYKTLINRKA